MKCSHQKEPQTPVLADFLPPLPHSWAKAGGPPKVLLFTLPIHHLIWWGKEDFIFLTVVHLCCWWRLLSAFLCLALSSCTSSFWWVQALNFLPPLLTVHSNQKLLVNSLLRQDKKKQVWPLIPITDVNWVSMMCLTYSRVIGHTDQEFTVLVIK